ncbi:hypothetical protein HF086_004700 [Spodoptera exigua]|uniref:glycogenin glucosyltransferase n=1 Tax=Spodoptera exigua TaxID=7107 RepID=A0A922M7V6_SPOEX|nr:hypothetical protein HF086_004700 [Spodoptera exigua]
MKMNSRERLGGVFAEVITVDVLDSQDAAHLALLQRPELGITFTKIHCWNLTQYDKCVFLDADTLVVQNCDELFEREQLSAAPDVGWPDCFNSGVFVYSPSADTFTKLIAFAQERGSFDGGDQGLLNAFFSDWAHGDINKHLPFLYNVTSAAFYSYLPALKHYGQNLKIIHFIGAAKPWLQQFNFESGSVDAPEHIRGFLQLWWDLFVGQVHSQLDTGMVEVADTHEGPPALPPHDVGQQFHYQPTPDPESEFAWHHPDTQTKEETRKKEIDITEFHDPWTIYRGHIPPNTKEEASQHEELARVDDHEEIRKYAWEYQAQGPPSYTEHNPNQNNQGHYTDNWQHNIQHGLTQDQNQHLSHWHQEHNQSWGGHDHHNQNYDQHTHAHHSHDHHDHHNHQQHHHTHHSQESHDHHSSVHYDHHGHHSHDHYFQHKHDHNDQHGHEHQHHHSHDQLGHHSHNHHYHHSSETYEHHHQSHYDHHSHQTHDHHQKSHQHYLQPTHINENTQQHSNNHTQHIESVYRIDDQRHDHNYYDSSDPNTQNFHAIHKVLEQHVQEKKVKKRNRRRRLHRIDVYKESILNGEVSGSETDDFDDIMPRHPYDGFYLRHRVTVDARGRKVCSHEVPPTPSPSPPPDSPVQDDSHLLEQSIPVDTNISDEQSGVAGNLARVLPGSAGQREALDELSRRQGWEAGNIDYMGADSFANIWAKISQTLSKPRTSPAKQSPPKSVPEQVVVQSGEGVQKPEAEQVEVAKEVVPAETAPPTAVEAAPAPLLTSHWPAEPAPAPVEAAPAQADAAPASEETVPTPVEPAPEPVTAAPAPAPAEAKPEPVAASPVPVEAAVKVEASEASVETSSASVEAAPVPVEAASAPAEVVPTTVEEVAAAVEETPASDAAAPAPVEAAPAPVEAAPIAVKSAPAEPAPAAVASAEVPVTVEAVAPVETSAPVAEVPVTVEAAAPVESAAAPVVAAPSDVPVSVEAIVPDVPVPVEAVTPAEAPAAAAAQSEAPKTPEAESVAQKTEASPVQSSPVLSASDSPPLAHTPSKEEASSPLAPAAKSEERRKPAGKLKLSPPAAADPLPTPDSELEDAAALASDIIARELLTPTVTAASPPVAQSPAVPENSRLAVEGPEVPTPPVGAVSLAQIGVKVPPKGKSTTAAQIESSITETVTPPTPDANTAPATPPIAATSPAQPSPPSDAPKKKIVKKVVKKDKEAAAGGDAPVPPPRKKEKKPKEK